MPHSRASDTLGVGSRRRRPGRGAGCGVGGVTGNAVGVAAGRPIPLETGTRRRGNPPMLVAPSRRIRKELGRAPRFADLGSIVGAPEIGNAAIPPTIDPLADPLRRRLRDLRDPNMSQQFIPTMPQIFGHAVSTRAALS